MELKPLSAKPWGWLGWTVGVGLSLGLSGVNVGGTSRSSGERPNVLFLVVDDLNDWVGCLGGHPQARTPHIDRLAARGTLFANAHCQSPLCNPTRSSVMTGLRPSTTGIYGLAPGIRDVEALRDHVTLPQTTVAMWEGQPIGPNDPIPEIDD